MEAERLVQGAIVDEDGEQGKYIEHMELETVLEHSARVEGQITYLANSHQLCGVA